ncbi:hypothetical protein DM02DRAFT_564018 [Periconia macrospinosa]|uniref:Uncharacterized protein n=1 Tax=Periconia macrospinosa TaxID=97972 RepID=A0A2V1DR16_9PLEO|nr:hypothetical protein DM02DRAFT_564018 [Periconia macrospinosa]
MARRSARLRKRSPSPADQSILSNASWETARSEQSPPNERLPSVVEDSEPADMKTPQKPAMQTPGTAAKAQKASQLPQSTSASTTTPVHTACSTPKNRTPIMPPAQEMHPALHHASTAKMLDEARWLGFQNMGAYTAPPKASVIAGQATPSKTPASTKALPGAAEEIKSPSSSSFQFKFRIKSPFSGLSPTSSSVLKNTAEKMTANARDLFKADEFTAPLDMEPKRKTAVPKGKMKRFSDVHMKQFKKMDSIANHPSSFRTVNLVDTSLKKSPSKADLNKPSSSGTLTNKLKRTQSKMDLSGSSPALERKVSKTDTKDATSKIASTPLKRTQSKMDLAGSSLPRSQSTVRMVPPSRDGRPATQDDNNPFAKRIRRTENDDAATARPVSRSGQAEASKASVAKPATPARKITSQTALPRLASRLMTPTKSSLARSQTVKAVKSQSMIPSLLKSPSTANLFSPTNLGQAMREGVRDGVRKTSDSLQKVKSILRTPRREFSNDMAKVAAGTHMSPPADLDLYKALPVAPQTAPAKKHVLFSSSTLERDAQGDWNKSPSPMKLRAGSEVPSGAVIYPTLQGTGAGDVEYPAIPADTDSPSRRLTFSGVGGNTPGEFSFKSGRTMDFAPTSTSTIRVVRKSNASSLFDDNKRKLNTVDESSDKENSAPGQQDEGRSAKKVKMTPAAEAPKTPSKLPRRTPNKRGSAISKSRLAFLSTPKRAKA